MSKISKEVIDWANSPEGLRILAEKIRNPIFLPGMGYTLMKISDDDPVPEICLSCKNWIYDERYPLWYCGAGVSQIYRETIEKNGCDERIAKEEE